MNKTLIAALLLLLAACKGGNTTDMLDAGLGDATQAGDDLRAPPDLLARDLRAVVQCSAKPSYTGGTIIGEYSQDLSAEEEVILSGPLNSDALPDYLSLELFAGFGAFSGLTTLPAQGTYQLTGDELNYGTCGVCLLIYTDISSSGKQKHEYLATGGTVSYSTVNGQFIAKLTNVTFEHVIIDQTDFTSVADPDGCVSAIGDTSFEELLMSMPDMTVTPTPDLQMPDIAPSDLEMPDIAPSDLQMPDMAMPDMAMPDLVQPDLVQPDLVAVDL